jgi:hypothetical protein
MHTFFVCVTAILPLTSLAQLVDGGKLSAGDQLAVYLHNAPYDDMLAKLRTMGAADKAMALAAIKKNESGIWETGHPDILLYLGDGEQRKKAIAEFRRQRFFDAVLVKLGEPWVVEELAPEMFREEEFTNLVQGDILNYPLSYGVAGLIIANLQNATIYSDEVLQWAKRTSPHALPQLRAAMRDWWRENERFFKEKNYRAVRPGHDVPLEETKFAATPVQAAPLASLQGADETPLLPAPTRVSRPAASAPTLEPPPPGGLLWAVAAAAVALLAGLVFFWKRRA